MNTCKLNANLLSQLSSRSSFDIMITLRTMRLDDSARNFLASKGISQTLGSLTIAADNVNKDTLEALSDQPWVGQISAREHGMRQTPTSRRFERG